MQLQLLPHGPELHLALNGDTPYCSLTFHTQDELLAWAEEQRVQNVHVFTIREAHNTEFIGECALLPVMFGDGNYTIGYQLDEPYWGRGYGTRACEFIIWYGFFKLGARRLSGDTLGSNVGSARIMEKCGFTKEGMQSRYYLARGQVHDNVLFGLLREELTFDLDEMTSRFHPVR